MTYYRIVLDGKDYHREYCVEMKAAPEKIAAATTDEIREYSGPFCFYHNAEPIHKGVANNKIFNKTDQFELAGYQIVHYKQAN